MPGPKYVKDFEFPSGFGFSGSAGQVAVRGHARQAPQRFAEGGPVKAPSPVDDPKAPKPSPPSPPPKTSLVDLLKGKGRKQREAELGLKRGGKVKREARGGPLTRYAPPPRPAVAASAPRMRNQPVSASPVMRRAMGGPVKAAKGGDIAQDKRMIGQAIKQHVRAPKPRGHGVK